VTTIHEHFERTVDRTPDDVAIVFGNSKLTYRELNNRSNQLARYLIDIQVLPGMTIGLCVEPSLELAIGSLGILKAQGVYLPLDPAYPRARLRNMLVDSGTGLVVTTRRLCDRLPSSQRLLCLDENDIRTSLSEYPTSNINFLTDKPDVAYLVYTSGSTGNPKGVEGTHKSLLNRLRWGSSRFPYEPGESSCQKTPISFVDSLAEIYAPLIGGSPLVILPNGSAKDPTLLVAMLALHGISRLIAVPSLIKEVCDVLSATRQSLPSLKLLISSGEVLTAMLAIEVQKTLPQVSLVNLYGSSEVGADVTCFVVPPILDQDETVPIGKPISNTILRVLDEHLRMVPGTAVGELYVGGDGLARGYINRPDETAARFIADPFDDDPEARLYRTGDFVRRRADGNLEYCGRVDHQIKIRGVRVELGEIEQQLQRISGVGSALVIARLRKNGETYLTAYLIPDKTHVPPVTLDRLHLQQALSAVLPPVMVPSHFVFLESFPLTDNGKLDRLALPAADESALPRKPYTSPSTSLEWTLAAIWSEVLGIDIDVIGVDDEFFALGGHSFALLRLVFRVSEACGCPLDIEIFARASTITALAQSITQQRLSRDVATPRTFVSECQLTPPQLRVLKGIDLEAPQIRRHNMEFLLCVKANRKTVAGALLSCLARHDVFRIDTMWQADDGRLFQRFGNSIMRDPADSSDAYKTLSAFIEGAKEKRATLRPASGDLFYLATYGDTGGDTYIYALINHLIFDGYSQQVLMGELASYIRDAEAPLPTSLSFYDRSKRFSSGEMRRRFEARLPYWESLVGRTVDPLVFSEKAGESVPLLKTTVREYQSNWNRLMRRDQNYRSAVLLAACVHSVGTRYHLRYVFGRIVGSGRMVASDVNDSLTVGYVSDHYPQMFDIGDEVTQTFINVRRQQRELIDSGVSYPWLRHAFSCERLVHGAQIDAFPFHFNYLPYFETSSSLISDRTDLLGEPDTFLGDADYAGLAFFVAESLDSVSVGLYRNTVHVRQGSVDAILEMVISNIRLLASISDEHCSYDL